MKFSLRGTLQLKPFDETVDALHSGSAYENSAILTVLVIVSALSALLALCLAVVGHPASLATLGVAFCLSSITAGLEWHAGLQARACNQLFVTVIAVAAVSLAAIA